LAALIFASGADVTIAIFGDFDQVSAKKWRFSLKPMLRSLLWHKIAVSEAKSPTFLHFLGRKYF
jgi:hypothetical protein